MKKQVSVVKDKNTEKRIEKCIELLGGMKKFISKGDIVFLKPNLIYPAPPPMTTDTTVVGTLVRLVKEAGASRILVGEGGAPVCKRADGFSVHQTFESTGMLEAVESNGGEIVCLDVEEYEVVDVLDNVIYKQITLPKILLKCNKIIGIPVMKTHYDTDVSLGIKGWHGVIADDDKFWKFHRDDLHQKLVDLVKAIKPCLTVIDGTVAMEGLGPLGGSSLPFDLAVASSDTVAADAVTAKIMGFDPSDVDHIRIADMQNVGEGRLENVEVLGNSIEEVQYNFKKPDYKVTGIYENVTVIEGGTCRSCKSRTRWSMDQLHKMGKLKNEKYTVLLGIDPYIPDPNDIEGKIVIVGNCACFYAKSLRRLPSDKGIFIHGCPPIPVPLWVPHYFNDKMEDH